MALASHRRGGWRTGRLALLSLVLLVALTTGGVHGQSTNNPKQARSPDATAEPPKHQHQPPHKRHLANTGVYAEGPLTGSALHDTSDEPSSGLPASPQHRGQGVASVDGASPQPASSAPRPTVGEGSTRPPVPGGAVAGTVSTPLPATPGAPIKPATTRQPPVLPTYDLTHSPSTSRPANPPPNVPNAPSTSTPVPPTARPPAQPHLGAPDMRGPGPAHTEVDGRNAEPLNPAPKVQATPTKKKKNKNKKNQKASKKNGDGGNSTSLNELSGENDVDNEADDGNDDDLVLSDDPHSLPIPSRISSPSGFPLPQHDPLVKVNQPPTGTARQQSQQQAQQQPHDPIVHVTPPPTGGWRAGDLRKREEMASLQQAAAAKKQAEEDAGASSSESDDLPAPPTSSSSHPGVSNSYISAHGPSSALRRNQSQWYAPPDLLGPMPYIDPTTYKPAAAPQYWMPDEAHIQMLVERHDKLKRHRVHREGVGARTTRLASVDAPRGRRVVEVRDNMLFVEGEPFWIQGICYSPVPIGESVSFAPKGDYFTPDFAYIWQRDLPLIKAMGATTLRIYGWAAAADHTMFLDAVHAAGLKVLVTYYLGDATQNPVSTVDQRNQILIDFVAQVHRYADHPAILMWSFGNELNGAWNGFAKQFSDAFTCWWQAGCAGYADTNSDCQWQSSCMYYQLFSWINAACRAAKMVTTRPIISGFADVDYMVGPTPWLDKVARFNYVLPDMDAWAVQLYRGFTFGGYFGMYRGESWKPMLVTEFGVDAYNDPCGWPESNTGGCFNMAGEAAGGADDNGHFWGCAEGGECAKPGVQAQAEWDVRLAQELMNQYVDRGGIVWGGFLMAWTDEWWKGGGTQDLCAFPCHTWDEAWCRGGGRDAYRPGGSAMCSWRAHFTCPNFDTNYHDLCGYFLAAAPDNYVNEEWFGITAPIDCGAHKVNPDGVDGGYRLDSLYVRPAFLQMMQLWSGLSEVDTTHATCDALRPCWQCSISHTLDDLNDGACERECAVGRLAVGPGSSVPPVPKSIGGTLLHGSTDPDSFWAKFGIPMAVGAAILAAALVASIVLWRRRRATKMQSDMQQPLVRPE